MLLTPSYTNAVAGATALNVAGGMSGFAGAWRPNWRWPGSTAQDDAIEEALGQLVGDGFTPEAARRAGGRWEITRNYFRLYACCNPIHPALDCLEEAWPSCGRGRRRSSASSRDLPFASVMRNPDPPNYFASKYSLPHAAAAMVVRGGAGFADARRQGVETRRSRAAPAGAHQRRPGDERASRRGCARPG